MCLLCYLYPFFCACACLQGTQRAWPGWRAEWKPPKTRPKSCWKPSTEAGKRSTPSLTVGARKKKQKKKTQSGAARDSECVRVYVCVGEKERWRRAGSRPGQAQLDACQLLAHGLGGAQRWEDGLPRPRPLPKLRLDERSRKQRGEKIRCNSCKWVTHQTLTTTRSILIKMPVSGFPNNTVQQLFNYWIHNVPHRNTIIYRQRSTNLCTYSSRRSSFFSQIYVFGWLLFSLLNIYAFHQAHHTRRWHVHSYFSQRFSYSTCL